MTPRHHPTRRALLTLAAGGFAAPALAATTAPRVLSVDTRTMAPVGRFQFPRTLPLQAREVALTFDDGPHGGVTPEILDILARRGLKATFFMIGRNARGLPALARRVALAGHTVGHHSQTHPAPMTEIPTNSAIADIQAGMASIEVALGDQRPRFARGFFRYPGLWNPPAVDAWLKGQGIGVFGVDVHARDWELTDPRAVADLALSRLDAMGRGIFLLHDNQAVAAAALPLILDGLDRRGWRVVHLVGG